jgi:plasmid maintenance system killer protein
MPNTDRPELCPAGHPLDIIHATTDVLEDHLATLDAANAMAELRCLAGNLMELLAPKLNGTEELVLRTYIRLVQRFDAGDPTDNQDPEDLPVFPEAITAGTCSCTASVSIYDKINAYVLARRDHAIEHAIPR